MLFCISANSFKDMTIVFSSHSLIVYSGIITARDFQNQPLKWFSSRARRNAFCLKMGFRINFPCTKGVPGSSVQRHILRGINPRRRLKVSSMNSIDFEMFRIGPLPGDIAEIEAYCRIFRAAEQLHSEIMNTLCDPVTGECAVTYAESQNGVSGDVAILQEKVVAALACMATLLQRGREEVLSGRLVKAHSLHIAERNDDKLPPLAIFREEMKDCCCKLQSAIQSYFMPSDKRTISIWTSLQRLKNLSYDAGFPRSNGSPCHAVLPNWSPVSLFPIESGTVSNDSEVAFWRGGQVTEEGLKWLIKKGYKTIVDLRAESIEDPWSVAAVEEAVHLGKIQLVHIPVKIGNAPTGEQVEEFTKLIQNFEGMPLYLHSQEGILRTSAMVSRWRESALRNKSSSLSSNMHNTDQILQSSLQNDEKGSNGMYHTRSLEFQQSEGEDDSQISGMENGSLFKVHMKNESNVQSDSIFHHNVFTLVDDVENSVNDKKLEEGNDGVKRKISPFEAQRPRCDILSRREMSAMFKNGKISPTTFFACDDKRTKRSCQSFVDEHSKNNNTLPSSAVRKSASEENNQKLEICRTAMPMGKNNGSKTLFENRNSMLPVDPSSHGNDIIDPLEGDLCVSTTGVVRVQSRKKAEMYLVRTDGFSCTRERVKESLLAFTHPSTQQQMLMWKTPPKTVLLLKKLGEELVEEAKQVASYLYYKERMNVVVEPEVHDMFSRVPGFSFIQTFYNHDINDLHERVDFVACLGGDGVILHASNLFREAVPPVVSFNLGSLGFLTAHHVTLKHCNICYKSLC
eukprot:TRINITY_DN1249_c0_g1_i1.p1 TRINITY_DN1249_c0_g1~~TRINITY_DN1249_c0_g1_i1.p1  ORF type:complete len:797 (-),score=170.05 TRINITY_DN1249_c0_g1_i1:66-2456(-)